MKLLLDENLPHDLRDAISSHDVFTVSYMKWKGLGNGALLVAAARAGFDALVTTDQAMSYQQYTAALPCAVVVLHARSNALADLLPPMPELQRALASSPQRVIVHVGAPQP